MQCLSSYSSHTISQLLSKRIMINKKAVLSQGEPSDAAVNFGVWVYLHLHFFLVGSVKRLFSAKVRFDRSTSLILVRIESAYATFY